MLPRMKTRLTMAIFAVHNMNVPCTIAIRMNDRYISVSNPSDFDLKDAHE